MKMKVFKSAEDTLCIQGDFVPLLDLNVKTKTGLSESAMDSIYEAVLIGYRLPGMDASKQIIAGDRVSVCTLTASLLENLLRHKVITDKDLLKLVNLVLKSTK